MVYSPLTQRVVFMFSSVVADEQSQGHGTLNAIYASVEESCRAKGWDTVDFLIICGDFQAVRNAYDLNVTAMPSKYRRMADFHEYYSGARVAPYLTIFIGGNHEASNYLFELHYGGWVAPNIYYMGAANILRLGPLRIAGLSGIWKGYDYRKPHFERLPYNSNDYHSIFHVRELDVRKLLSVRSQVDIGLSHDWPNGVEWRGQHRWLFSKKDRFKADAISGKLGSVAAAQCLDRLRPAYWFSAHLHIKYPALIQHGGSEDVEPTSSTSPSQGLGVGENSNRTAKAPDSNERNGSSQSMHPDATPTKSQFIGRQSQPQGHPQISAWHNSHVGIRQTNAEEHDRLLKERQERHDEVIQTAAGPEETMEVLSLDGGGASSLKRRRGTTSPKEAEQQQNQRIATDIKQSKDITISPTGGIAASSTAVASTIENNPDAVEIDLDDTDSETGDTKGLDASDTVPAARSKAPSASSKTLQASTTGISASATNGLHGQQLPTSRFSPDGEDGGVRLNPGGSVSSPVRQQNHDMNPAHPSMPDKNDMAMVEDEYRSVSNEAKNHQDNIGGAQIIDNEVSEEMRAQLAALSRSFAPQSIKKPGPLPFPEAISNKTTHFLALDKCDYNRDFLQLLEVEAISEPPLQGQLDRPFKLQYDPEWLAILRVFAPDLELGGNPAKATAPNRGEGHYRDRIAEEAQWIEEHVVTKGLLEVPENFTITAPIYDRDLRVDGSEMPREYTNPQTSAFCNLLGIENPFDLSEDERDTRMARGPRPQRDHQASHESNRDGGSRGRDPGRGGQFNHSRGRAGGRSGGRGGRGSGRGQVRGRW
jgi:lariat debranching enzyme